MQNRRIYPCCEQAPSYTTSSDPCVNGDIIVEIDLGGRGLAVGSVVSLSFLEDSFCSDGLGLYFEREYVGGTIESFILSWAVDLMAVPLTTIVSVTYADLNKMIIVFEESIFPCCGENLIYRIYSEVSFIEKIALVTCCIN